MPSEVDVCNIALAEIGADLIMTIDQNTSGAKACNARLADVRDGVLRAHPWNCAVKRFALPVLGDKPAYQWSFQYRLPTDPFCLRVLDLAEPDARWQVEGRLILTDVPAPLRGRYIARVTDPNEWDALLVQAVAMRLAAAVAYRVTNSAAQGERCLRLYEEILRQARSVDAQEEPPAEAEESSILMARY